MYTEIQKQKEKKPQSKVKYTCPDCNANLWGKPNMRVICGECGEDFEQQG